MALPPNFLDELRFRTPLPGLIGRKTRLVRNGRQWKGCCPFHNEKTPSFYVYDDHFHCFGCGAHGDAFEFLRRSEGAGFMEAVERLAAEAGLQVPQPTPQAAAREARARDLYGVLALAQAAFARRLRLPEGRPALDYLLKRGLTEATIERFGLGWSGEGRGVLAAELKGEGVTTAQLVTAGLMKWREPDDPASGAVDLYFNRVMFPIRDRRGRPISFGGRIMGDGQPKYVNGPETELFQKRKTLYGQDLAKEGAFRGALVVAVEGYMDVIALHQAGFAGAVAPLGTALTAEQLEALWALSPEPVLCFDGDAAGARAAARAAEIALPLLTPERTLRLATLPSGEDPDTLVLKQGAAGFQKVLDAATPMAEALYGILAGPNPPATPEQRAALRARLEAAAQGIGHKGLAGEYRRALLDRFFASQRRGAVPPSRRAPRPVPGAQQQGRRARILLAILLHHPNLLQEVEEPLGLLELPAGPAQQLRAALMAWLADAERLDSAGLMDHLHSSGLSEALAWAIGADDLPPEARPAAQPKEALDGWWHFYGFLRGEDELLRDRAEAQRLLAETNDPAAQARLRVLTEALAALRRGDLGHDEAAL
jgi:DNA primase